jgi:hypothetical protein
MFMQIREKEVVWGGRLFPTILDDLEKIQHFSLQMARVMMTEVDWKRDWFSHRDKATAENKFNWKEAPKMAELWSNERAVIILRLPHAVHNEEEEELTLWVDRKKIDCFINTTKYTFIHPQCRPASELMLLLLYAHCKMVIIWLRCNHHHHQLFSLNEPGSYSTI